MDFEYLNIKKLPLPHPGEVPVKLLGSVKLLGRMQKSRAMGRGKLCVLASLGCLGPFSCACQHIGILGSFPHFLQPHWPPSDGLSIQ